MYPDRGNNEVFYGKKHVASVKILHNQLNYNVAHFLQLCLKYIVSAIVELNYKVLTIIEIPYITQILEISQRMLNFSSFKWTISHIQPWYEQDDDNNFLLQYLLHKIIKTNNLSGLPNSE